MKSMAQFSADYYYNRSVIAKRLEFTDVPDTNPDKGKVQLIIAPAGIASSSFEPDAPINLYNAIKNAPAVDIVQVNCMGTQEWLVLGDRADFLNEMLVEYGDELSI